MLEAADPDAESQAQWHRRLFRALRPYGHDSTSVGDALRRAGAELRVEADGRGFGALGGAVLATAARGGQWLARTRTTDRCCRS